tara:strand:+ start:162 stop:2000 length:1839 start_codon:yes stop_codon:yes gene_type:complete
MKSKFKKSLICAAILSSSVAVANTALDSNNKKADYLITYEASSLPAEYQQQIIKNITQVAKGTVGLISLTEEQASALQQISGVRVELDVERFAILPQSPSNFVLEQVDSGVTVANFTNNEFENLAQQEVTPYGITLTKSDLVADPANNGIKVCVIDSGIQGNHEEFAATNLSGNHSDYSDFWFNDAVDHGTHVAGTIIANRDGKGVVGVVSNGAVDTYVQKLSRTAHGANSGFRTSHILETMEVCANQGANIINMSLGGSRSSDTERDVVDRLTNRGVLIVAAAGNHGSTATDGDDSYLFPASYKNVMSVASVDQNTEISTFSAVNDQVEIAAPGTRVLSTVDSESVNVNRFIWNAKTGGYFSSGFKQIDAGNTPYPRISQLSESCFYKIPFDAFLSQYFDGTLSATDKAGFDAATAACQANEGQVLVTYFDVPAGIPDWVSRDVHNIDYATDFPTLTVANVVGELINSSGLMLTEYNKYGYEYKSGTSMATPHVSGVAAKVWSHFPNCTGSQIRDVLNFTATDIGAEGKDHEFGHGLVDAKAAYDFIAANGCDVPESTCPKAWYENQAYTKGDQVTLNGQIFEANYWTKNDLPSENEGQYKQWKLAGSCAL